MAQKNFKKLCLKIAFLFLLLKYVSKKSDWPSTSFCLRHLVQLLKIIINEKKILTSHVRKAAEQEGQEQVEDDQIGDQNRGQEVGDAGGARDVHAVPHRFDPLAAEHPEYDHDAEKDSVPSIFLTGCHSRQVHRKRFIIPYIFNGPSRSIFFVLFKKFTEKLSLPEFKL